MFLFWTKYILKIFFWFFNIYQKHLNYKNNISNNNIIIKTSFFLINSKNTIVSENIRLYFKIFDKIFV